MNTATVTHLDKSTELDEIAERLRLMIYEGREANDFVLVKEVSILALRVTMVSNMCKDR